MAEEETEIIEAPQIEDQTTGATEDIGAKSEVEAEVEAQPVEAEPAAEEVEPQAEETLPIEEEAAPPEEETVLPVEEEAPPEEEAAPTEEEAAPTEEEAAPPEEEAAPPEEEAAPIEEEAAPTEEETVPTVEEAAPPEEETVLPVKETAPFLDRPTDEGEQPTDETELPTEEPEGHDHDEGHEPSDATHSTQLPAEYADILRSSAISSENYAEVHDAFCLVSETRGYIEGRDLLQLMLVLGQDCSCEETVQQLLEEQGLNDDSHLGFAETVTLISNVYRSRSQLTDDLMSSFRVFDRNGNGYLEYDELFKAMFEIGSQALEESAREDFEHLVRLVDKNQDGKIDYSEFCQIVTMSVGELRRRLDDD